MPSLTQRRRANNNTNSSRGSSIPKRRESCQVHLNFALPPANDDAVPLIPVDLDPTTRRDPSKSPNASQPFPSPPRTPPPKTPTPPPSSPPWRPVFSSPTLPDLPRRSLPPVKLKLLPLSPRKIAQAREYYEKHPGTSVAAHRAGYEFC